MFETMQEKATVGLGLLALALLVYVIWYMPEPTSEGYCVSQCDTHIAYTDEPYMDWLVCGSGCLIEKIEYNEDTTKPGQFAVTCKCCECLGSSQLELPECTGPLGFVFKYLGRCI